MDTESTTAVTRVLIRTLAPDLPRRITTDAAPKDVPARTWWTPTSFQAPKPGRKSWAIQVVTANTPEASESAEGSRSIENERCHGRADGGGVDGGGALKTFGGAA